MLTNILNNPHKKFTDFALQIDRAKEEQPPHCGLPVLVQLIYKMRLMLLSLG